MKAKLTLFSIFFCSICTAYSQNRHYDYRNRVPGDKPHILYISGDDTHGSLEVAVILRKFLEVRHEYFITYTEDYSVLTRPLDKYDLILMNNIPPKMSSDEIEGLKSAVSNGKPFLGLHAISATYKMDDAQKSEILDIVGGQFKTHPPIYEFEVNIEQTDNTIVQYIPDFKVYDEMYFFSKLKDDINVLMTATYKENDFSKEDWDKRFGESKSTPIAWTTNYGKGKVFYTSLGHGIGVATNRYFQQLVLNGLSWLLEKNEK
ncbi:ThuA domain-containing protein [Fulvivirgaceae bacterium BMA12]|uniref:ThuA domain-containing protein n=1 Tax=Agaribacillus aureus TaxID=3051825 RepID=A0ABT8LAZ8_9BACT|nr:ThuA domain-containing protein [Fulvivirgaceae bacterium BMA12]